MLKEKELLKKFETVFEVHQAAMLAETITDAFIFIPSKLFQY